MSVTAALRRRGFAWLLLAAIITTLLVIVPGVASAETTLFDCKESPTPTAPSSAGPAIVGAHAAQEPTGESPFASDTTTTVYREYGWITTWWPTYDLGCGPDVGRSPDAVIGTFVAELLAMGALVHAVAFDTVVHAVLDWSGLGWVDAALEQIVADVRGDIWIEAMTLVALLAAMWFVMNVVRGDMGKVTAAAAWTAVGAVLLAVVVNYPAKTSQVFDGALKATLSAAYGGAGDVSEPDDSSKEIADGIIGQVFQTTVYDRWCEGMVGGSTDSASRWCPQLWQSMYLSRTEAQLPADQRGDLIEQKRDRFEQIADEMQDQDPSAYQVLQGKNYQSRLFAAGASNIIWPVAVLYPIWSLFVLLISLMLLRVMVLLAPVAGPFLLHPSARDAAKGVLKLCGGAFINAVVFCVSSAIYLQVVRSVLASQDASLVVRLTSLFVLTVAFWVATKPWRRMTTMGRGLGTYVNKLSDDKLSAARIGRQALRTGYMVAQLKTMGFTAKSAKSAGNAAEKAADSAADVADAVAPERHPEQPTFVPHEADVGPASPAPPPSPERGLPGATKKTTVTDDAGQVYEAEVVAHGDTGFSSSGTHYSAANTTDRDPTSTFEGDGDEGPIYTIYEQEGGDHR